MFEAPIVPVTNGTKQAWSTSTHATAHSKDRKSRGRSKEGRSFAAHANNSEMSRMVGETKMRRHPPKAVFSAEVQNCGGQGGRIHGLVRASLDEKVPMVFGKHHIVNIEVSVR